MTKPLFANEKVMKHYLDALLQEDSSPELSSSPVENLLSDVETKAAQHQETSEYTPGKKAVETLEKKTVEALDKKPVETLDKQPVETPAINAQEPKDVEAESLVTEHKPLPATVLPQFDSFNEQFQALYFEVAGLTLAVPLNSLGGIYQLGEINRLIGKPDWFSGVMLHRDEKLSVVDTARWVMPEKYNKRLEEALNYQYLIVLGNSQWGLLAERLVDNVSLTHQDIKWRDKRATRPWLAGLIKDKMCALIDVSATKALLEQGLDSKYNDR
jgi:purine-binding chemotaxis protein CheW